MDVDHELLPEHPIEMLIATKTHPEKGIHNGEPLGFRCLDCGNMDEDVREIIHEEDCELAGETQPTAYADRRLGRLDEWADRSIRADGGE